MREEAEEGGEEIDEEETQNEERGEAGVAFLAMMTGIALRESVIDTLSVMTSVV